MSFTVISGCSKDRHGSVKVADCPCLLAADCVQSLIAFRRRMLEIWLSSERFRLCHDFDGALQGPSKIVDIAVRVCYTGITPIGTQYEDKEAQVLAERRTAGRPCSRRPSIAPKEGTR
jgi:hypothetical protein